jgi:hypothetical protein
MKVKIFFISICIEIAGKKIGSAAEIKKGLELFKALPF